MHLSSPLPFLPPEERIFCIDGHSQDCALTTDSHLNAPQGIIRVGLPSLGKGIGLALQVLLEQQEKCAAVS